MEAIDPDSQPDQPQISESWLPAPAAAGLARRDECAAIPDLADGLYAELARPARIERVRPLESGLSVCADELVERAEAVDGVPLPP
jgi:hypothetical protein